MNFPMQREPVSRTTVNQINEQQLIAAVNASGINPSDAGIQPDGWEDIVGGIVVASIAGVIVNRKWLRQHLFPAPAT